MIEFNEKLARELRGKSLIEMYFTIGADDFSFPELKKQALADFNAALGTNYKIQHIDNWVAGRKPTPRRVQSEMRRAILLYVFGEEIAADLGGIC